MPDTYTEVTRKSWGSRLGGSFKGIFFGFLLFLASFVVLFWNEGRVDISNIAATALPIEAAEQAEGIANGTLVAARGELATNETLGDEYLTPGPYLELDRNVEVYAWVEHAESESEVQLGGAEETRTTYSYSKEWVSSAPDSSNFKIVKGHANQSKTIADKTVTASKASVGVYSLSTGSLSLPASEELTLTEEMVDLPFDAELSSGAIYFGFDPAQPEIGDMRITYTVVRSGEDATVFGMLAGTAIQQYADEDGNTLYTAMRAPFQAAVAQMHKAHTTSTWWIRLVGFLMMWFGLASVFGPLSVLLDVLPIAGKISRSLVSGASFLVALVLSIVTIIVSMILHNVIALLAVIVGGIIFAVWYIKKKGKKAAAKMAQQ